ncbi:MAG: response regulator, partial [Pseudomonadota bacterium]|nr:response regulator [Pseudomonadota bacterium]
GVLQTLRQRLKYSVIDVCDGKEALQWVAAGKHPKPSLLLFDMGVPGDGDLQIIREIKAHRPQMSVLMLMTYGNDNDDYTLRALQAGVTDMLTKPVVLGQLKRWIENALEMQRMRHQIQHLERMITERALFPDTHSLLFDTQGHIRNLKSIETEIICFVLGHSGGCMARAARSLGIGRSTLYRRIGELEREEHHISRANHTTRPMMRVSSNERS